MSTFTDFLKDVAQKRRTLSPELQVVRARWIEAVKSLIDECEKWLREADTEKVLFIHQSSQELHEEKYGLYKVPALEIALGPRMAELVPIGRDVQVHLGDVIKHGEVAGGRVDIRSAGIRFHLYRIEGPPADYWLVVDPSRNSPPQRFDKRVFESILLSLLG